MDAIAQLNSLSSQLVWNNAEHFFLGFIVGLALVLLLKAFSRGPAVLRRS
jgi:hypothetical protein